MDWLKQLQKPNYWLLGLAAAVVALHLTLLDRSGEQNLLSLSILLWLSIASLLWDKREDLKLESGIFSSLLGIILLAIVLARSLSPAGYHFGVAPFLSGLALCLMASGVKQLHQYWKEIFILSLLAFYPLFTAILKVIDLPLLTAKVASFNLWLAGFDVHQEGVIITLPTGKVEVLEACAGLEITILMFVTAVLFLLLFPQKNKDKIICLILAPTLGFFINSLRICILALLVAEGDQEGFKYWHGEDGSFVFALISVFIFGLFCWFFYIRPSSAENKSETVLKEVLQGEQKHD
ncbi:cyanoexosortase A [Gloeothece verrucosa]|uniref:Exosortase EpsH-related protein n=1 Tax=Gloeothece verrucosa (strain PCC 7822) TaxID=497965 RepID=E0U5S2_GLOV7|nr:cyanoexosortase A [Gloeothece verrucosa]ADN15913.1 Exosortase EpsH-related protein [Gloeothece verrucosa PCC 7822]